MFLGGHPGEVFLAEIETGTTPFLLSIPALVALDAVVFVKDRKMQFRALGVELPLLETRTKHLALKVCFDPQAGIATDVNGSPRAHSINDDLFVYYVEEATFPVLFAEPAVTCNDDDAAGARAFCPQFGPRGIRKDDEIGRLSEGRAAELAYAIETVKKQDDRTWAALGKHDSLAEQAATKGFTTTLIFEPFGGHFGITRNSQPLDLLDGHDLLSKEGEKLLFQTLDEHDPLLVTIAFDCRMWSILTNMNPEGEWEQLRRTVGRMALRLVKRICKHRHQRGPYFLVENPAGSLAWRYHGSLTMILEELGGKYVLCDQCAFGLTTLVA